LVLFVVDESINLGKDVVKGEVVDTATKGISYFRPISRFDGVRKLIVLEWTPLNEKGQFGDPIRIPFLINPEAIDWSRQHVYSQQQTRGGWIHTHWNDKPLTIKIRGNSGAFEYHKINLLNYAFKVSGKSYLELKAYQERKGKDRDRFLSEHLGKEDAKALQQLLADTTFTNQGFFKDFLTNSSLYQYASVVGKEAFKSISVAASISVKAKAITDINNNLFILKESQKQKNISNQSLTNTSQTVKGSTNKTTSTPLTDNELLQSFNQIQNIPNNRLAAGLSNIDPNAENVDPALFNQNNAMFTTGIQTGTISPNESTSFASGYLNTGTGRINSNYDLLQNSLTPNQFNFLQSAQNPIGNFGAKYVNLGNPTTIAPFLNSINSYIGNYNSYSSNLLSLASNLIASLSLEDDIRNKVAELNTTLNQFQEDLTKLNEELTILTRQSIIQAKRRDVHLEEKKIKKIKSKLIKIDADFNSILELKKQLDALLIEPLSSTETDQKAGLLLLAQSNTQYYLKSKQLKWGKVDLTQKQNQEAFISEINRESGVSTSSLPPINGAKEALQAYHLINGGGSLSQDNALNIFFDDPKVVYDTMIGGAIATKSLPAEETLNNSAQLSEIIKNLPTLTSITIDPLKTSTDNQSLIDLSANNQESIKRLAESGNNYSIFDSKDFTIKPTLPDVVKLRLYYNGCIYEGFMADFNYHENAQTPNITYDFDFVVERELLGASLENIPVSIKNNPGSVKTYNNYRLGDFNPAANNTNYGNRISYLSEKAVPQRQEVELDASAPIGSQRPNLYPAPGTQQNIPTNPPINNPNNKVNSTQKNFGTTSDPSNLGPFDPRRIFDYIDPPQ
jgi:hypothetical protein